MKRSETVLVYGVTTILVVILGIAVIFGDGGPVVGTQGGSTPRGSLDLAGLLDPAQLDSSGGEVLANAAGDLAAENAGRDPERDAGGHLGTDPETGLSSAPNLALESNLAFEPDQALELDRAGQPLEVPLAIKAEPTVATLFGPSRIEDVGGDMRYRVVYVARGDALSLLVQRWCGSLDFMNDARALNEQIDERRLPVGAEIWLPYVDDAILLESNAERSMAIPAVARSRGGRVAEPAVVGGVAPRRLRSGSEYVLQPGENLWVIAVRSVSPRKAQAYIDEILELNPKITDPGRVRSGMKILLPETEN